MSEPSADLLKQFNKAKIALMTKQNNAFICTILFSLKHNWTDQIPFAGTDGASLYLNTEWFGNLSLDEKTALLAHEAWHVAFDHMTRGKPYNKEKYNIAADYVINIMLQDAGYTLPPHGCVDAQYRGMSTEEVYRLLPDPPPGGGGYDCDIMPSSDKDDTPAEKAAKQQKIKQILSKAAQQSQLRGDEAGTIPGDIKRMIDEIHNPKLDWFTILMNYMTAFDKTDYSFKRPNRRYFPEHYLPGLQGESMGELALAFDSSGSVSQKEFSAYFGETAYMRDMLKPIKTTIIDFDTRINNVYELSKEESMDHVSFSGGGGTDLRPVFEYYKDKAPTVLLVFSDFYCSKITKDPGYPVIWISVNNKAAEVDFGTLIHYDLKYDT